jgi:hypothetical protein
MKIHAKLAKLLEPLKYWSVDQKRAFMPIVQYAEALKQELDKTKAELREIKQPKLIEDQKKQALDRYPEGSNVSKSFQSLKYDKSVVKNTQQRLRYFFENNLTHSPEFQRILRLKRLSIEDAKELAFRDELK